jgi:fumarylacetoacetase
MIDSTHHRDLRSWVPEADEHDDFPIQNLPIGIFSPPDASPRAGIAIGNHILDLGGIFNLLTKKARQAAETVSGDHLNDFLALHPDLRKALRQSLSDLLREDLSTPEDQQKIAAHLYESGSCQNHLPVVIGDYTDFYAGICHAENIGKLFRPDNPLLPNYQYVPIGYHGRASSIRPSGSLVQRPNGQIKLPEKEVPIFQPSQRVDFELELGIWVGQGNELGTPIPIHEASQHISGFCLLNDWSARDIQAWEYQPLGPFLAKSFATTISPWIILPEALAPFRIAQPTRPQGDPAPLPYLLDPADQEHGAFDIRLEVTLSTPGLRQKNLPAHRLTISNTRYLYWTCAQLVTHHTSGGCNLRPGDLLGSGTISGPTHDSCGSLAEATFGGKQPISLPSGEERRFLEKGDEIILRAKAIRDGFRSIGFGTCVSKLVS